MKIIVNEMPVNSKECLFSYRNCEYGCVCKLKKEVCNDSSKCDVLTVYKNNTNKEERSGLFTNGEYFEE